MDQEPDELRDDIDRRRSQISATVDQIENRVSPSRVMARRTDRVRNRLTDWKDSVFGNDEPNYPQRSQRYTGFDTDDDEGQSAADRARDMASSATDTVQQAPHMVRRQTRGNPLAAGVVALGAGWLVGSLLPESRTERKAARRIEPQLAEIADTAKAEGQALAEDLKGPAKEAVESVKQEGKRAVDEVKAEGQEAAASVKDRANSE